MAQTPELRSLANGRFELRALIGEGPVGRLYDAWDHREDARRAIRLLNPTLTQHPAARSRFLGDPRLTELGEHPNLLRVYEVALEGRQLYQVLEPADGRSVSAILTSQRFGPRAACRVLVSALTGLSAAHAVGVVHMALGPDCVLVGADERAWVTEFGMGRLVADRAAALEDLKPPLRPTWLPPELLGGDAPPGVGVDIYAAGALLFAMILGAVVEDLHTATPEELGELLPAALVPVVARACAARPEDRFSSAAELQDAVLAAASSLPEEATALVPIDRAITLRSGRVGRTARVKRRLVLAAGALLVLSAVGIGLWLGLQEPPSEGSAPAPAAEDAAAAHAPEVEPVPSGSGAAPRPEPPTSSQGRARPAVPSGPPATLVVEAAPAGTRARVDGRLIGALPQTLELSAGEHRVDYLDAQDEVGATMRVLLKSGESARACWDVTADAPC